MDVYNKLSAEVSNNELIVFVPQIFISIVSWLQLILSLNRFTSIRNFTRVDLFGLLLFLLGGVVRWVAALAVRTHSFTFQLFVACLGNLIRTSAFVIVYNCDFHLPTQQQVIALILGVVITSLWELQTKLVFDLIHS